ncbi:MAG: DUF2075 domain-containing protein [Gammaproteobacteria bacterium]|nr:DUF2075 domain-containing protein [Gammaproteobacteria bacterium]
MRRAQYSDSIADFMRRSEPEILGKLSKHFPHALLQTQNDAWSQQIKILKATLGAYRDRGKLYFEYSIPRLGRRIDAVVLIDNVIFVLEFKIGASEYESSARDQVCDYALDLKNFHETSHIPLVAPVLIASEAPSTAREIISRHADNSIKPVNANAATLGEIIARILKFADGEHIIADKWERGGYQPTPTIIEAAIALYSGHSVQEISRNDAGAVNLRDTSKTVAEIIKSAKEDSRKAICFVTGVPGAGKTLIGLDIATQHNDNTSDLYGVFLSGNGPLVAVLREALARDQIRRKEIEGEKLKKGEARRAVEAFIQNVHHFRDDCISDERPPHEHVAIFDESQRAWNREQTESFMQRKKGKSDFPMSEAAFLISCLDRHPDWAVIVCLVGGGQDIKTGETGISDLFDAIIEKYPHWDTYISGHLGDDEYAARQALLVLQKRVRTITKNELHLSTSMRSFRAERISILVKQLLDLNVADARATLGDFEKYPIVLTRDLIKAKAWLRENARGSERYGMVVSSRAERLRPHAIDVRPQINPVHWFLNGKDDVRSSYYLEDVAHEFVVQGLEVDWACVAWDADFRHTPSGWRHWMFRGARWKQIHKPENQIYQKNAYRVLLTRARQGMVIVVPNGDRDDPTRDRSYYDPTFEYLKNIGFHLI